MIQSHIYFLWIGIFFLGLFLTGFWLNHQGKPYRGFPFNLHKFIGLGTAVYLGVMVYQINQQTPLTTLEMAALVITAAFFAITIVTGGLLNTNVPKQNALLSVHHVFPYLTVFSTATMFYLFYR